jgi:hypothetical protein
MSEQFQRLLADNGVTCSMNRSILLFEHRIGPKTGSHPRVKPEGKLLGPML